MNQEANWIAPIARWSLWDAAAREADVPSPSELGFIDPLLRRRLSGLAKMTLLVAHECAHDVPQARFVYASRHGELNRTTAMLNDLASNAGVSPTAFSMAVLNASAGLFSILQRNTAPSTAISAASASFGYGLLEACLQLADQPQHPVLFVYADEPLPKVYSPDEPQEPKGHAIGLLLQSGAATRINCSITHHPAHRSQTHGDHKEAYPEPQSRAFLRGLQGAQAVWHSEHANWAWSPATP